jgi:hypothetical protein
VAVAASLAFAYALSSALFLNHLDASRIGLVESVVIITQAVRIVSLVAYYGARPARTEVVLVLLSIETFVVMGLIVTYIASPSVAASQLAHSIFSTWIASLFIVLPPYLIFAGVAQMAQNRGLTAVILPLALEYGLLIFAATAMSGFVGTFTLDNFFDFLISAAKTPAVAGSVPAYFSPLILGPSMAIFCGLLVYATIPKATSFVPPRVAFVLPLISAAVALGWVVAAVVIVPNTLLSFTAPGIVIVGLLWAYTRR